jgi:hypothetical protein
MALLLAEQAAMTNPTPGIHSAGEVHVAEGKYDLAAALVDEDIVVLTRIPPGCIPIDARLEMDDLDTGTALVGDLALMELGAVAALADSELILDSSLGQAAGVERMDNLDAARRAVLEVSVDRERYLVYHVTTAPGTGATSGRIKGSILFRGKEYSE